MKKQTYLIVGIRYILDVGNNICLPKEHVALFIFGDSILDVGNNNYITTYLQANVSPYGKSFFRYPTGRFSNGRLIPDFIVSLSDKCLTHAPSIDFVLPSAADPLALYKL
nr:gdsl esterase/lipase 5 [Quercus suber]